MADGDYKPPEFAEAHTDPQYDSLGSTRPLGPGEWVDNTNGSWSNEISTTTSDPELNGGKHTVIPRLWLKDGKPTLLNEDDATEAAVKSGLNFRSFDSEDDANKFADQRESNWQNVQRDDNRSVAPLWERPQSVTPLAVGGALDRLGSARSVGYSWPELDDHIAAGTAAAAAAGYSQPEIDNHLGYSDPKPVADDARATWTSALSQPDHPLADENGMLTGLDLRSPSLAADYSRAVLNSQVKSPQQFADHYAAGFLNAAHDLHDYSPEETDNLRTAAATASEQLATDLPRPQDLIDAALSLSQGDTSMLPLVHSNLLNHWQDTGQTPTDAASEANDNGALAAKLTAEPPIPDIEPPTGPWDDPEARIAYRTSQIMRPAILAHLEGAGEDWNKAAADYASELAKEQNPTSPRAALEMAGIGRALTIAMGTGGAGAVTENVGPKIVSILRDAFKDLPSVKVFDPLKPGADAVKEGVPASEALLPPEPAKMVFPEGTAEGPALINPSASPAEKITRILQLEQERAEFNASVGTGTYFQDLVKQAEKDGVLKPDQATTDLAIGHDVAGVLRNLLSDDSGAGPNPFAQFFRTPAQKAEATYNKEGQGLAITNIIRFRGLADRETAATMAQLEPLRKLMSPHLAEWDRELNLGPAGNPQNTMIGNLISYVEGRSYGAALSHDSPLAPVADVMRVAYQRSEANLRNAQQAGLIDLKSFYEDFYAHRWTDRSAVDRAYFGPGRQGSGQSFQGREIPTIMDGISQGLTPKIRDPLDLLMDYTNGVEHRLSALRVMDALNKAGHLEYKVGGAATPGYVPLVGLNSTRAAGDSGMLLNAYASPGAAKTYNYWLSKGLYTNATGSFYDKLLYASNSMIGLKLAFPGYHALAIAGESWISGFAHAFGELGAGEFAQGLKDLGATVTVIPRMAQLMTKGYRAQKDYLNLVNSPTMDLLTASGMRPLGRQQVYRMGASPSIGTSIARRSLGYELSQDFKNIAGDALNENAPFRSVALAWRIPGFFAKTLGRVMNGITAPLFDDIIPWMKTGAAVDEIQMMLRQNTTMTPEQRILGAQKIGANIDNRLGELNQDNLFWPKWSKQLLNLVTVSMGWEYGSMRFLGGASRDLGLLRWNTPVARSGLGFLVATSLHNSVYQWMKTGQLPFSTPTPWTDLIAPRTGGLTPEGKPERAILPGYLKDVFGYARTVLNGISDPTNFLPSLFKLGSNKENPMISVLNGWITGEDKIGHKIAHTIPPGTIPPLGLSREMYGYLKWTFGDLATPIAVQSIHDRLRGTNINRGEQLIGLRPSPSWIEDPERYANGIAKVNKMYDQQEMYRARRDNSRLETPDEDAGSVQRLPRGRQRQPSDVERLPRRR